MPYKVLLVDDHKIIADGLTLFINNIGNYKVVGWAGNGEDALASAKSLNPDLVIMDYRLPDYDGIDLIPKFLEINANIKILILTSYEDADLVVRAINSGAKGYLTKNITEQSLKIILTSVMENNQIWLDPSLTLKFMTSVENEYTKKDTAFSKEERYLITLIAQGKSNKEIAEEVFSSENTIKNHLTKLYKKMGLRNRAEIAMYAIKNEII